MANYVSLEQAAKILGVSTDDLVEMRSRGEIFGYRDGTSWKFKEEEIERVQAELQGDALDEDAGGSSILVSERQAGLSGSRINPPSGKDASNSEIGLGSDLKLIDEDSRAGSDVKLVADPSSGSGVRLVNRASEESGLQLGSEPNAESDVDLGSELKLAGDASGFDLGGKESGGIDLGSGAGGSGTSEGIGSELELATDDEDDLVLGSDSGVGLASESGINLMSPSDSGLSLEDEPLDLAGTGISGLDLGAEVNSGSGAGSGSAVSGISGLGSGALVDFQQGEEFQLTPSGGLDADEDSGSQVIELEDSTEFGAVAGGGFGEEGLDPIQEADGGFGGMGGEEELAAGAVAGAAYRGVPETPYTTIDVMLLLSILILLSLCGVLVSDLARNMWAWDGSNDLSTGLTDTLVGILPK
jgi:excisionase family DNA binding protein